MFAVEKGGLPRWNTFSDDPVYHRLARDNDIPDTCVTRERWEGFYLEELYKMQQDAEGPVDDEQMAYVGLIQRLTRWDKEDRGDAQYAFNELEKLASRRGSGTLTYKKGIKRHTDQIS